MRHQKKGRKLGRKRDQRRALLNSLINHLVRYEKIKTSEAKAKEIRPRIEKLITRAIKNDLAAHRYVSRYLQKELRKKLIEEIAPRYKERPGGYTRIIKLGNQRDDVSPMAMIELI